MGLLLLVPQMAAARVYMCVDKETGEASFTDHACETASLREEVKVSPANLDSGRKYARNSKRKTWRSQEDLRKSGIDYNNERRRSVTEGISAAEH